MTAVTIDTGDRPVTTRPHALKRLLRNRLATVGLGTLIVILAIVVAAPILSLADPNSAATAQRLKPLFTEGHFFGTDQLGRDILSRLIWGTRVSIAVGVVATFIAASIGSLIGLLAAYYSRIVDNVLMRGIDMLMAFPYLLLALAIIAALGPGLVNAMIAVTVVNIPFFARSVRGATVSLVNREFVEAARLSGLTDLRIISSEIFPNVLPMIVITMSTTVGWLILETAGLSFLGLGAQPPQADLGSMLADGRNLILVAPHVSTIPGLVILALAVSINLLGDGLRDVLDPQLKSGALARPVAATAADPAAERSAAAPAASEARHPAELPILSVRNLQTQFTIGDDVYRAVNGVSFDVEAGESVGIVGESGCGKTVTAMSIVGLVPTPPGRIVGGQVLFHGEDLIGAPLSRLQDIRGNRIAYIFQDPQSTLNPLFRVGDQVAEAVRRHQGMSRTDAGKRVLELLDLVGIPDRKNKARAYPHEISGGQSQRVGIAMALANNPEIIIADEPTTALDVTTQAQILNLLNELRRETGVALIFITHDFAVVSEVCERVLVMYAGRIVEGGSFDAIFSAPQHPYTRRLLACVPVLGEPERAIDAIPGLPPAANKLPPGCAFAPRCDLASAACREGELALDTVGGGRLLRCIRSGEQRQ